MASLLNLVKESITTWIKERRQEECIKYVREHLPERRTQVIIEYLKPLRMLGDEDAFLRDVLFAELTVK